MARWSGLFAACACALTMLGVPASAQDSPAQSSEDTRTILILPFDMVDTSLQGEINKGPLVADVERLQRTEDIARRAIAHQPEFRVLPNGDVQSAIDKAQDWYRYVYACNGCEIDIGKEASADLVMTGWVQKVSNLILNVNATIRDVDTGREVAGASADMRSNTDDSWRQSALYMINHSLMDSYHATLANMEKSSAESE